MEAPSRNTRCDGGQEREYSSRYQYDYRYPLALGASALISMAVAAISVYRVGYRTVTSLVDVFLAFIGGVIFLASLAIILGYTAVNTVLQ